MTAVILLNADYTPLGLINWRKAVKLLVKKKVEVISYSDKTISNFESTMKMHVPTIVRLLKLIRAIWRARVPFNKRTVMLRDNHTCAYCGFYSKTKMTIDHVIPRSHGGKTTFENTVACCFPCNNRKDNRTPSEAKMYLRTKPVKPTIMEFIIKQIKNSGLEGTLTELEKLGVL